METMFAAASVRDNRQAFCNGILSVGGKMEEITGSWNALASVIWVSRGSAGVCFCVVCLLSDRKN